MRRSTLLAAAALFLGGSVSMAAESQGRPAEPGGLVPQETAPVVPATVGEDGRPLPPVRGSAPVDLLHPELREAAMSGEMVEVFLLLAPLPGSGGPDPAAVKAAHMPGIREISEEIRAIELRYRPKGPRTRDEEKGASQIETAVSDQDRALRRQLQEESDRRMDAMRRAVANASAGRSAGIQEAVARQVERLGGTVRARVITGNMLDATISGHALQELAEHPLVARIVPRHEGAPALVETPTTIGMPVWYSYGLDGGVYDVGVADTGVQQNHPAFSGINFYTNTGATTDPDGHGTHVAGIIASRDPSFRGIAYGLDALIWGQAGGYAFATMDWAVTSAGQAPEIFNQSWGYGLATDEDYNFEDRWFDVYIDYYDVLIAFAAGNLGWNDTTLTMQHPVVGYNAITVANMNSWGNTDRSDDVRAGSSAVGPTLAGRRKPDITAPGTFIRSTNAFWTGTGVLGWDNCNPAEPNDFCFLSGTSMASPHVAGAALVLHEGGVFDSKAQKAILINTAEWWTSNNTEVTTDDGPVALAPSSATQWDKSYGWGYLDMDHAYTHRTDYFLSSVIPRNDNAVEDDYKLFAGFMNAGDRATLVWHRRGLRGSNWPDDKFDSSVYDLSDLNMRLYAGANGNLIDADTVSSDTVHQVHALANQNVVVKVYAWSTVFDAASSEAFALATEEGFQAVDFPETFGGTAFWPGIMEPNEEKTIEFWVVNNSTVESHLNSFDLILPAGWTRVAGSDPAGAGSAPGAGGSSNHVTWTVRAPATTGAYTITSQHTHSSYDESYGPFNWNMGVTVETDVTPPTPNPMYWGTAPYELNTSQIRMTATTATDIHGPVEYYHDYNGSPTGGTGGTDSGWTTAQTFTDSGLLANHNYCYRIWARDNPLTAANNATPSPDMCDYTDITTPTGITFGTITTSSIQAQSTNTPTNLTLGLSGLWMENMTTGANSGWKQNNNLWTSPALGVNTAYTFRALARNGDANTTLWSPTAMRYTLSNAPTALSPFTLTDTSILAQWGSNGNPAGTEYYVENLTNGTNSGWITTTSWDSSGLVCGGTYSFRVRARNGDSVQTALVSLGATMAGADFDGDLLANCIDPDDDNDGVNDPSDCSVFDAVVWAPPGEVSGLALTHSAGTTTISWNVPVAPGTSGTVFYDTALTKHADGWTAAFAACVENDDFDLSATHTGDPAPGEVFFVLTRPENRCGNGDEGKGIDVPSGTEIPRNMLDCGCAHAFCDVGVALDEACDTCVAAVCAIDSFCCADSWDSLCVGEVTTECGITCPS